MIQALDVHLDADHHRINIISVLMQQQVCDIFRENVELLSARVYTWK